jgi:hypothetical protein
LVSWSLLHLIGSFKSLQTFLKYTEIQFRQNYKFIFFLLKLWPQNNINKHQQNLKTSVKLNNKFHVKNQTHPNNYLDKHSDQVSWQVSQKCDHYSVNKDYPYLSSVTLFFTQVTHIQTWPRNHQNKLSDQLPGYLDQNSSN